MKTTCLMMMVVTMSCIQQGRGEGLKKATWLDANNLVDLTDEVVSSMWDEISTYDDCNNYISSFCLDQFFHRYYPLDNPFINVFEPSFVNGDPSWTEDFSDLGMIAAYSMGYFRSFDVHREANVQRISAPDTDKMMQLINEFLDLGDRLSFDEREFKDGMNGVVLRCTPFSYLFTLYHYTGLWNLIIRDRITDSGFEDIFHDIDADGNGEVIRSEMEDFWNEGFFGSKATGGELFDVIDYEGNGVLTILNWEALFVELDCDNNEMLNVPEFLQLDLMVHDIRTYPGECNLERL